jgi:hypothetical protein
MRAIVIFTLLFIFIFAGMLMVTGTLESRVLPLLRARLALDSPAPEPESPTVESGGALSAPDPVGALSALEIHAGPSVGPDSLRAARDRVEEQERDLVVQRRRLAALEATVGSLLSAKEEKEGAEAWQTLVRVFSSMRPEESAPIIAYLPDGDAVRLLATMKPRDAGQVMGLLDPERAALLSRQLATGSDLAEEMRGPAAMQEPGAAMQEPRAAMQEPRAAVQEPRAAVQEPRAVVQEPEALPEPLSASASEGMP